MIFSIFRTAHWSFCLFWFVLGIIHGLFLFLEYFLTFLWLFRFIHRRCDRSMIFLFFSLHDRPHHLIILLLLFLVFHWGLHSQLLQILLLPLLSLLFLSLHNICIQGLSVLTNWEFLVIIHRYFNWLLTNNLFVLVMEILHISVLQGLLCCVSTIWVKYKQML